MGDKGRKSIRTGKQVAIGVGDRANVYYTRCQREVQGRSMLHETLTCETPTHWEMTSIRRVTRVRRTRQCRVTLA